VVVVALDTLWLERIVRFKRPKEYLWVQALRKGGDVRVLKAELRGIEIRGV
jgi:hypothetical protein